jgi:ATP-dependent helicase YprA (DUF1998 family)
MTSQAISRLNVDDITQAIALRSAEAALGRLRLSNAPLREHLRTVLTRPPGTSGSLIASPVLEAAFGYATAPQTLDDLSTEGLLHPASVAALGETTPLNAAEREGRNTLPSTTHPYEHQLAAWRALAHQPPRCIVVSSGTGSGKTEAFLVPILDALARQTEQGDSFGVQALLLYPLNALIASQRDRLADWTAPFEGRVRFCLYNGETPEQLPADKRRARPYEAMDREQLRSAPPQILVTNATMLEYMLLRDRDAPILAASRGKLRWIVLDEAHTYLGSQAAEMTLLLRRALLAFGVQPSEVSFIATSATLGGGNGDVDVEPRLRRFLAAVAGVADDRVDVIFGRQCVPHVDRTSSDIAAEPHALAIRARLAEGSATLDELVHSFPDADVADILRRGFESTGPERTPFLPLRLHLFHRAQAGVFACLDPSCPGRLGTPLDRPEWPFGAVYERDTARCATCGGRTLEVLVCDECGHPVLDAALDASHSRLDRWREAAEIDEFAVDQETTDDIDEEEDEDNPAAAMPPNRVVLFREGQGGCLRTVIDAQSGELRDRIAPGLVPLWRAEASVCPHCGAGQSGRRPFRPLRLGGPFFLGVAGNVLLDAMPPRLGGPRLPNSGRQLITFTDNRQGTARFAATWQQERERSFARARIWHRLHQRDPGKDETSDAEIAALEALPNPPPVLRGRLEKLYAQRAERESGCAISWSDMRDHLAALNSAEPELLSLWRDRDAALTQPEQIARQQLLTEFLRRPRRANSLETMGLAALQFPALQRQGEAQVPPLFRARGASLADWRDFLHVVATYFVRANSAVHLTETEARWLGESVRLLRFIPSSVQRDLQRRERRWPLLGPLSGRAVRPVLLLRDVFQLNLDDRIVRDEVNEVLDATWSALAAASVQGLPDNALLLDLTKAEIVAVSRAWLCPVTGRVMDRTFRGTTAYVTQSPQHLADLACAQLVMPRLPFPWLRTPTGANASREMQEWLSSDPDVRDLRARGLWTDIADRLALLAPFARIVEHSAQQPSYRLRDYEDRFKRGEINVLNCSTTMEMGVDIGGIVGVAMANVPPSPANYRQRVGRAGRRGEPLAVAFTYCGDTPLGWHSFDKPGEPLRQSIAPPRVALDSRVLAQRHANALLLAAFLRRDGAQPLNFTAGAFFNHTASEGTAPWERFVAWLRSEVPESTGLDQELRTLLAGTGLADAADVTETTAETLVAIADRWLIERRQLATDLDALQKAARTAVQLRCDRMDGEFLLGELVRQAFLPGHGFPTDVAAFVIPPQARGGVSQRPREDNGARWRGNPTRRLDIALAEYAPGADVVLDGVVYRAGGVTLNWKRPASADAVAEIQALRFFWRCRSCDAAGDDVRSPDECPACGNDNLDRVRALRPAGFAADPEVPATNAVEFVERLPQPQPLVSARGAAWVSLPNPALGRFRSAADGLVMSVSRGVGRHGYAVCLACGRSALESGPDGGPLPAALSDHRSLRRSGLRCEGARQPFAIQRHLAFGQSRRTEVYELQLAGLGERDATTVAVALREALCGELGIERAEVAWAIAPAPGEAPGSVSLFLFDTAAGGAGYAGSASTGLPGLLAKARAVLDCSNPGCERACPSCLILRDTVNVSEYLDRRTAAALLDDLIDSLRLPEDCHAFPEGVTQYMAATPLPQELLREAATRRQVCLSLFLHGDPSHWDFDAWWGSQVAERVVRSGVHVRLLADSAALHHASWEVLLALRALCDRAGRGISVHEWGAPPSPSGLLAVIESSTGPVLAWATAAGRAGNAAFATAAPEAVVCGTLMAPPEVGAMFDPDRRMGHTMPNAWSVTISEDLNGSVTGFGERFWQSLTRHQGIAAALHKALPAQRIEYDDRYLVSPVGVRLLQAVVGALQMRMTLPQGVILPVSVNTMAVSSEAHLRSPTGLRDNWPDSATRNTVICGLLRELSVLPEVVVLPRSDLPHARTLKIIGQRHSLLVTLDQGFGFWQPSRRVAFDFGDPAERQVDKLARTAFEVRNTVGQATVCFIRSVETEQE